MINDNTLNFIRFSSGFNSLKKEELEAFAENEIFELNEYNASEKMQSKHFYTSLQSTDGTQGVAQEDGKYTHTAWAYNSDGTDGFTTVYPKLNLLTGTSTKEVQATVWNMEVADIKYDKSLGGALCASVMFNNADHESELLRGSARIYLKTLDKSGKVLAEVWGNDVDYNTNGLSQCHIRIDDNTASIKVVIFTNNMNVNAFYSRLKVEKGSIATPYMQSASEVTTADWPSYIGQYTDYTLEDSINPSSYTWIKIQGKYFYTLEDVNTNGTLKSYIIECLKLSLQTRWGNNLEYHIDRKTKYLNKLTGMQV